MRGIGEQTMRLIDVDELNFEKLQDTNGKAIPANEYIAFLKGAIAAEELVKNAPTIDAEPVVHAHWIISFDNPYRRKQCFCSACGKKNSVAGINQEVPYCHWCGAKMDEEVKQ